MHKGSNAVVVFTLAMGGSGGEAHSGAAAGRAGNHHLSGGQTPFKSRRVVAFNPGSKRQSDDYALDIVDEEEEEQNSDYEDVGDQGTQPSLRLRLPQLPFGRAAAGNPDQEGGSGDGDEEEDWSRWAIMVDGNGGGLNKRRGSVGLPLRNPLMLPLRLFKSLGKSMAPSSCCLGVLL